jgi:rod shape-determining protein MreC
VALSRRTGRSRFTLILLVLTSVTLLTLDFRGFGPLNTARSAVLGFFSPVGDFASGVFEPVGDAWDGAFNHDELARENEDLRQRVDELEGQITGGEVARQSLQQLLEQADLEFVGNIPTVQARVVSGAVGNFDATIEIDRGERHGIRRNMAVVTGRGLIGKVVQTSADRSVVELLSGGSFSVGFSIVGTNVLGVVSGPADGDTLSATVELNRIVLPGQILVTSGVQGSTFPQGLPIGIISGLSEDDGSLTRELQVQMLASTNDLSFVSVVVWEPEVEAGS